MIPITTFSGKDVALFGLGGSGLVTARALVAGGANVVVYDDNHASVEKAEALGIKCQDFRQSLFENFEALVLAPGVPLTHPKPHWVVELAKEAGVPVIGDIELFAKERELHAPSSTFIAITGTNGKSTTTALISHILRNSGRNTQMGGNIGKAVLSLDALSNDAFYVVECSSYQIDLAPHMAPTIGVMLNLTPDHLDRHGSMANYAAIKQQLVTRSNSAVVGVDDPMSTEMVAILETQGKDVHRISSSSLSGRGVYFDGGMLIRISNGTAETIAKISGINSLRGVHNGQNAAAAYAVCKLAGLSDEEIQFGLSTFAGLAHRMEQVAQTGNVVFVNDSKATNADAAAQALSSFERIYWIAGGLAKDGGIEPLREFFPKIAKAYLIGEAAPSFAATLGDAVEYEISGTIETAVRHANGDVQSDKHDEAAVLFSPACASFDQFRNFELRGEAFRRAVEGLDHSDPLREAI